MQSDRGPYEAALTQSKSISSVSGPVFTREQLGVVEESMEWGPPGQGGVVHGEEVDVQVGHGEVAGGVVSEVQAGGEENQVD